MNYLKNLAFSSSHNIISNSGVYIDSKAVLRRGVTAPEPRLLAPPAAAENKNCIILTFPCLLSAECPGVAAAAGSLVTSYTRIFSEIVRVTTWGKQGSRPGRGFDAS